VGFGAALREWLKIYGVVVVLVAAGFAVAFHLVDPAPPTSLRIASGPPGGAYAEIAERYKAILARDGIQLEIVPTVGSLANLKLLTSEEGGVDIAFVQGGTGSAEAAPGLVSLASLFFEPVWVFVRGAASPKRLAELAGRRVAVGIEGSGTRVLALELLTASGVFERPTTVVDIGGAAAIAALLERRVDAAVFVSARPTPALSPLLEAKDVHLVDFEHAEAYKFRYPYLSSVTLPAGVIRLDADIPPHDITLLAPAAALVAREGLHPALIDLLMAAVKEVHQPRQLFARAGVFPATTYLDFPIDPQARRNLESGPSFLRRVLPFWGASLVERLWVLVLPLITLALPLLRIAPPTYRWQVRRKIYRWYKHLRQIEEDAARVDSDAARAALVRRLEEIQRDVGRLSVPLSYADQHYHLRLHIEFLRRRIEGARSAAETPAQPSRVPAA
jgi:TRAP transporter TAXI family solute receptor